MSTDRDPKKRKRRPGRPSVRASTSEAAPTAAADSHPIMRAAGGWADYEEADNLLVEIYADRKRTICKCGS